MLIKENHIYIIYDRLRYKCRLKQHSMDVAKRHLFGANGRQICSVSCDVPHFADTSAAAPARAERRRGSSGPLSAGIGWHSAGNSSLHRLYVNPPCRMPRAKE